MDENKLNIETVDGHNELVVSFLSRMVSLSDEEKQTVLSCLPDTGKQTITQLYEALRSQGHQDLAEKVEPYLQQGVFGPIFDNAKSKVFVRDEAPFFLMDENPLNWDDAKAFNLLRMSTTCVLGRGGWTIGERFDDRFDTEVGGTQLIVTQSLNEKGEIEGGLPTSMSLNDFAEFPKQPRPPQIVDYQEDKRYTLEEAEAIPELAPVVQRLKERIEEYEERRAHD
ncbi:thymidylate kinase [Salmonella enterica]|nr:thymidylate kinase [Salmonella enterica]